jgi:hypothetical protein
LGRTVAAESPGKEEVSSKNSELFLYWDKVAALAGSR